MTHLWTWCDCNEQRSSSDSNKAVGGEPANSENDSVPDKALSSDVLSTSNSNLVFGYLNLFSDGVVSLLPAQTMFISLMRGILLVSFDLMEVHVNDSA